MSDRVRPAPPPSRGTRIAAAAISAFAAALTLVQELRPSDDAYITFRHARHLAAHGWPAWNLTGDPVLASTSPIWMVWLGTVGSVVGPERIEAVALTSNAALAAAVALLAFAVAWDLARDHVTALLASAAVAIQSVCVHVFAMGFEAALLLAVVLGCLLALRRDAVRAALLLAGIAPLVRPEGLLLWPIAAIVVLRRRHAVLPLAPWLLALPLAWTVAATAFYGSPVPHSIVAKQRFPTIYRPYSGEPVDLVARLPELPAGAARILSRRLSPVLLEGRLGSRTIGLRTKALGLAALVGIAGLVALLGRGGQRFLYVLYPIGFVLLHAWIGALAVWYLPSFVGLTTLLLFTGAGHAITTGLGRLAVAERARRVASTAALVALFALFASANRYEWRETVRGHRRPLALDARGERWEQWERERFAGYRAAARAVATRARERDEPPGTALISEIGFFGYFYPGPVIDAVGIASPEAFAYYPPPRSDLFDAAGQPFTTANNIVPSAMVRALQPDYVVGSLTYLEHLVRPGTPFLRTHRHVADTGVAWERPIAVYERAPHAPASPASKTR